jgi:hypothetical protein
MRTTPKPETTKQQGKTQRHPKPATYSTIPHIWCNNCITHVISVDFFLAPTFLPLSFFTFSIIHVYFVFLDENIFTFDRMEPCVLCTTCDATIIRPKCNCKCHVIILHISWHKCNAYQENWLPVMCLWSMHNHMKEQHYCYLRFKKTLLLFPNKKI